MEYPHKVYIQYLLSKKLSAFELRADCMSKGLMPPSDEALHEFEQDLGPLPRSWNLSVRKENLPFRRWLRDKGLLGLWSRTDAVEEAFSLLARASVRKDFEAVILTHGDVSKAREELLIKYPESLVPSVKGLGVYYDVFWNVGAMSSEGLFEHLEASQDKEDYLPAAKGDLVTAYSVLGLQQQISYERLLQETMEAGFAVAQRIRREADTLGGQTAAGLMSAVLGAMKAGQELRDLHVADGTVDTSSRKDAADFMYRRITQVRSIPSIDEVDGDIIDADYAEAGADNVHRLPVRND